MRHKSIYIIICLALIVTWIGQPLPAAGKGPNEPLGIVTLSLPSMNILPGDTFTTSLQVTLTTEQFYSGDFVLNYDSAVLTAVDVQLGTLSAGWSMFKNMATPGVIRVAMASATPITTSGELLKFTFTAVGSAGSNTDLELYRHDLDENTVLSQAQDGYVYIAHRVMADFSATPLTGPAAMEVNFSNLSTGDFSAVLWEFGDVYTSTETSPKHTYALPGTYSVNLTVSGIGGTDTKTRSDYITTYSLTVTGHVQYWKDNAAVPGVLMTLAGSHTYSSTTDLTGAYTITGVLVGDYTLTPSKNNHVKGISAYDASLVLQHAANGITLSGYPALAADVTKNGLIQSFDASYILQKAVELISLPFPGATSIWEFDLPNHSYTGLNTNQIGQDFTAILLGDPSGNWSSTGGLRRVSPHQVLTPAVLSIQGSKVDANGIAIAAVKLDPAGASVYSLECSLHYDPSKAQFLGSIPASATTNWLLATNASHPGEITLGLAGSQALSGQGDILYLRFKLTDPRNGTLLQPVLGSLNEGAVPVTLQQGVLGGQLNLYIPVLINRH